MKRKHVTGDNYPHGCPFDGITTNSLSSTSSEDANETSEGDAVSAD